MELGIKDRLVLASLLPQEANFAMHKIIERLRCDLSFSEEENKEFKIVIKDEQTKWDETKDRLVEIEIGPKLTACINETLVRLNDKKQLRIEHLSLYQKFVVEQPEV